MQQLKVHSKSSSSRNNENYICTTKSNSITNSLMFSLISENCIYVEQCLRHLTRQNNIYKVKELQGKTEYFPCMIFHYLSISTDQDKKKGLFCHISFTFLKTQFYIMKICFQAIENDRSCFNYFRSVVIKSLSGENAI